VLGEPIVTVRGEAVLEVDPEIATLRIYTIARDKDRDRAVENLGRRSNELDALLEGFGDAVESVASGSVTIHPEFKDGRPTEKIVGYEASMSTNVVIAAAGFDRLGDLVSGLGTKELTSVSGPWWSLRPDSDRYREARSAAALDAVRRAREYAAALGASLAGLVELADQGLLSDRVSEVGGGPPMPPAPGALMAASVRRGEAPPPPPTIDFSPAPQRVSARVEARFTITQPTFD
jgi:hypothetical protein